MAENNEPKTIDDIKKLSTHILYFASWTLLIYLIYELTKFIISMIEKVSMTLCNPTEWSHVMLLLGILAVLLSLIGLMLYSMIKIAKED